MNTNRLLGYSENDRLLIINADDLGMCHSSNMAIFKLFEEGYISSSTLMTPCPWVREVVKHYKEHPDIDIGVHLTFTSEWENYKWGPVTRGKDVSSLITPEGYFPQTSEELEGAAKRDEIRIEIKSQIELAFKLGIEPSHLDNHMGTLYGLHFGKSFLDIIFDFCHEYQLPFRLPKNVEEEAKRLPKEALENLDRIFSLAEEKGIILIDHLVSSSFNMEEGEDYNSFKESIFNLFRNLKPGISEFYIHPGFATEELKAINPHWQKRQWEFNLFIEDETKKVIEEEGIKLIRWKDIMKAQRKLSF
ncbi:MAG: polysaccharide deacetylase family protein [bacterium]